MIILSRVKAAGTIKFGKSPKTLASAIVSRKPHTNQSSPHVLAEGVYAALVTPRRRYSTEADAAILLDYLDAVASKHIDGVVLFGATGEFIHFDIAERTRVLALAARRSRVPMLVNVSHSTLDGAVELGRDAVEAGAAGLLLMPPYFYRYSDDQILSFYLHFAESLEGQVPLYLYHLPLFTNPISERVAVELLNSGAFAGIKDSSGDWAFWETLLALRKQRQFRLLLGNEEIYLQGRIAGADGIISGVSAAIPELIVAMDRAIRAGNLAKAEQLNTKLMEFIDQLSKFPPAVGIKQLARMRGWQVESEAVPLGRTDAIELQAFQEWARDWIPQVLKETSVHT